MKEIVILETFEGYPDGKTRRAFAKGETVEVANDFADLVVGKGHAKDGQTKAVARAEVSK